jgi:hypothetical protein
MALPVLDIDDTLASIADSSRRWTDLLRSVQEPSRDAIGHWTIRDVAVHLSHVFGLFPELVAGGTSPIQDHLAVGVEWDAQVKKDLESDLEVLAHRVEVATKEFVNRATPESWTREVYWHGGLKVPVYSLAGFLINEAEIHGHDVATAEGRDWSVARDKAVQAIVGHLPALPHFVDSKVASTIGNATYELRLRGGPRVYFTIADGSLSLDTQPRAVDCHLSVDPVEYLMIGYGRKSRWGPIATGKVTAWGRKPLLALKFPKLFHSP